MRCCRSLECLFSKKSLESVISAIFHSDRSVNLCSSFPAHWSSSKNISFSSRRHVSLFSPSVMSKTRKDVQSLSDKIDSNKPEGRSPVVKKRRHLTVKSDSNGDTAATQWNPPNWNETLEAIRKMRRDFVAPVDNMGCDQAADTNEPPEVWIIILT